MTDAANSEDRDSPDRIERDRAALLAEAAVVLRERPDLRIVGMVIEPEAPEAEMFRRQFSEEHHRASLGFVGIVERHLTVELLGRVAPDLLDWLDDDEPFAPRQLPVVYFARTGMRTAALPMASED